MNKFIRSILAILGGIDTTFYMFTPIIFGILLDNSWIFLLGLFSSLFRAYKIGWTKNARR